MPDFHELDKILTLGSAAMTFCACIVVGYVLKIIATFPNKYIPLVVILTGATTMLLMADKMPEDALRREWITRHFMAGLVLGFLSWMAHNIILKRIEDVLVARFDSVAKLLNIDKTTPPTDTKP